MQSVNNYNNNIVSNPVFSTIMNAVLGIGLTQLNYDTDSLTIGVSKIEGELAPEYSFSAFVETVLNSGTCIVLSENTFFIYMFYNYRKQYKHNHRK